MKNDHLIKEKTTDGQSDIPDNIRDVSAPDPDAFDMDIPDLDTLDVETIDIETSLEDFEDEEEAVIREISEAAEQLNSEESDSDILETARIAATAEEAAVSPVEPSAEDSASSDAEFTVETAEPEANSSTESSETEAGSTAEATEPEADSSAESSETVSKRSPIPYVIIGVLSVSLVALGGLTFMSLNRLASLQSRISQLQQTVVDISDSASTLSQKAEELKRLQDEEAAQSASADSTQTAEIQGPQFPAIPNENLEEQGTLSPSSGNDKTFTNNTDSSMDSLLVQIEPLLPQNNGNWSVYVCNLSKGSEGVIGGGPMQAASLIKLYIMGTVYENYDSLSQLHGKESLDEYLRSMITVSDNDAANTLVNWLGSGDDTNGMTMVNEFCKNHGYTETSMGRMLLASNENGDNYTSVTDCGKFLKEIYQINAGTVTDSTLSHADSMYYLLKLQERNTKMPAKLPDGVHVAHKTGELTDVESDAGIIYDTAQGIDLVVCFMSENLTDAAAAQTSIAENTRLIYGYYNE